MNTRIRLKHQARGPWEVVRRIRLPALATAADAEAVRNALAEESGVKELAIDLAGHRLLVRYDVNRLDFQTLLQLLENAGYPTQPGLLSRLRAGLYQYADTNARENARTPPPPCCNKPPR